MPTHAAVRGYRLDLNPGFAVRPAGRTCSARFDHSGCNRIGTNAVNGFLGCQLPSHREHGALTGELQAAKLTSFLESDCAFSQRLGKG